MPQEGPVLQKVLDVFGAIFHFSPLSEGQSSAATQSRLCVSEPLNSQSLATYLCMQLYTLAPRKYYYVHMHYTYILYACSSLHNCLFHFIAQFCV